MSVCVCLFVLVIAEVLIITHRTLSDNMHRWHTLERVWVLKYYQCIAKTPSLFDGGDEGMGERPLQCYHQRHRLSMERWGMVNLWSVFLSKIHSVTCISACVWGCVCVQVFICVDTMSTYSFSTSSFYAFYTPFSILFHFRRCCCCCFIFVFILCTLMSFMWFSFTSRHDESVFIYTYICVCVSICLHVMSVCDFMHVLECLNT